MNLRLALACVVVVAGAAAACGGDAIDRRPATLAYLLPAVFVPHCATARCHAGDDAALDLAFDGGDPVRLRSELVLRTLIFPGQPEGSPLLNWLRGVDVPTRMPPDQPLSDADIDLVEAWIAAGAP